MANQTITVSWNGSAIITTPNPAPEQGHESAPVLAGRHVQWVAGTGVSSISAIYISTSNIGIFSSPPTSDNSWLGTVSDEPLDSEESYFITVNTANDGPQTFDPKIKVNPAPPQVD